MGERVDEDRLREAVWLVGLKVPADRVAEMLGVDLLELRAAMGSPTAVLSLALQQLHESRGYPPLYSASDVGMLMELLGKLGAEIVVRAAP